jgi:prepilin-type processing-associated H-X9-DG protein
LADQAKGRSGRDLAPFDDPVYYAFSVSAGDGNWYGADRESVGPLQLLWTTYRAVINNSNVYSFYSFHEGGANVLLGDGSVRFLRETVAPEVVIALLTRDGAEIIPGDTFE